MSFIFASSDFKIREYDCAVFWGGELLVVFLLFFVGVDLANGDR